MRCSDCKSRKYCDNADKVNYCAGYIFDDSKPKMQTNEDWFCGLPTEEKAKWFAGVLYAYGDKRTKEDEILIRSETWLRWLKEKHYESV